MRISNITAMTLTQKTHLQPVGHDGVFIHEVPYALQHRLEVVLLCSILANEV